MLKAATAALVLAAAAALPLQDVARVGLPGSATRLDYQTLDQRRHLLFIAHLGDSSVIAVDTKRLRVAGVVHDISQVHGVLAVPERNRIFASATGTNELIAIDETTLRVTGRVAAGIYPDGIAYDPENGRLYVSDEQGGTDSVIDAGTLRPVARIDLGGQVGNTQFDPVSHHIFVNAEGANALVEIDPRSNRIVARTPLPGCSGNHGLLIDPAHARFFVACEGNATLVQLERPSMHIARTWSVGETPDVLALDGRTNILYVASESGTVTLFRDAEHVTRIAQGFLAPEAHTVAVDDSSRVYFPIENDGGRPVVRVMRMRRR